MRVWFVILAVVAALSSGGSWPTHRSTHGGYTIRYPPRWRVTVLQPQFTTFSPPAGGPAIKVYVYPGHGPASDDVLPDVQCRAMKVGRLRGRRCRSLVGGSPVTIFTPVGRTYRISSDAGIDVATYDRVVASFRLIRRH